MSECSKLKKKRAFSDLDVEITLNYKLKQLDVNLKKSNAL